MVNIGDRVRALVRTKGASAAARALRMPRGTVLSIAGESPKIREGTLVLAEKRLAEMEAQTP